MESSAQGQPAKILTMNDLVRSSPCFVRVWIQDAENSNKLYFNSTACFDRPFAPTFNQVDEKGLDTMLKDIQEVL